MGVLGLNKELQWKLEPLFCLKREMNFLFFLYCNEDDLNHFRRIIKFMIKVGKIKSIFLIKYQWIVLTEDKQRQFLTYEIQKYRTLFIQMNVVDVWTPIGSRLFLNCSRSYFHVLRINCILAKYGRKLLDFKISFLRAQQVKEKTRIAWNSKSSRYVCSHQDNN